MNRRTPSFSLLPRKSFRVRVALMLSMRLSVTLLLPVSGYAQSFCEPVSAEPITGAQVLGNGTPGSVSTAQIQAALDVGGAIRFNLGSAPSTLVLSAPLVASKATVLDGDGLLTLSGGSARRIMRITNPNPASNAPPFRVTLQNINFILQNRLS